MIEKVQIKEAHKHSSRHRNELRNSECCGCFYCTDIFDYKNILDWVDDDDTALCPTCGIDSVVGSAAGYPINLVFLQAMRSYWF